jgi:signal transduction histidine kinase
MSRPEAASEHERVNILLVDDQPGKLLSYEAMLSQLGENLIMASSGREALDHLLRNDITVVITDVSMPELDGFELAEIIRQHPRYQKTAIIFVSAVHLTDIDRLKGYESGAVDYVSVPVVPELLRAKVSVFTELYRKTRESERLTRDLEKRVIERTAELEASMSAQVELARQLREADRRKDEFLALLSHELRNPLAPVCNAVNIMRLKQLEDPDLRWCREVIERQAAQLTRLVDDLLDVSRITQGKITLRPERVNLAAIVADAIETSRPQVDAQHHELVVSLPETPVEVHGDRARLTQVVANLLNNAAKYQNAHGWIRVTVDCVDDVAQIIVEDRGIGISEDMLARIFELFSQGERAPDRAQGGLGVGLSLVKNLMELHSGSVRAESQGPGKGSTFVLEMPCFSELEERDGTGRADAVVRAPVAPERIIVVDDNTDAAESLAVLLRLEGHEVAVAHNGTDALALATRSTPTVVLLDIGLPGMDGYEVCRRLRDEGLASARIIAMTGYGQERDRRRSAEAGFDAHTVKPVAIDDLMTLLHRG